MSTRYRRGVVAAVAFSSAIGGWGVSKALADDKMAVTAVGCLQAERDYRQENDRGKHGRGLSDEFVLIGAVIGGPALNVEPITEQESTSNCIPSARGGQAFELTGHGEPDLANLVGRRVVIHGMLKHAKDDTGPVGTSGTFTPLPTNGGSGIGRDLNIREINVDSFSLVPVMAVAKDEPVTYGAPEPAVAEPLPQSPTPPAEAAPPAAPAPVLPKTASPLPAIGLFGMLCLACGLGLRLFNRTQARYS